MDSASRLSDSAKSLMQSLHRMTGQGIPQIEQSAPPIASPAESEVLNQPQPLGTDSSLLSTQPEPGATIIQNPESSIPERMSIIGDQMAGQQQFDQQNSPQFVRPSQETQENQTATSNQESVTQETSEQTQADGQLSDEEIEYLRQSGRLPYIAPATPMQESALIPGAYKPMPEELLLEWVAPSRPFKKPKRNFFTTITIIGALIGLILFFANQWIPVAVVISVVFLVYVLYSIPPGEVHHALTTYGLRSEEKIYYWEELGRFWITQSKGQFILNIEVSRFPNRLSLLLGDIPPDDMTAILSEVLLNEVPALTQVEKMAEWLKKKVPLDLED